MNDLNDFFEPFGLGVPGHELHAWRLRPLRFARTHDIPTFAYSRIVVGDGIDLVVRPGSPRFVSASRDRYSLWQARLWRSGPQTLELFLKPRRNPLLKLSWTPMRQHIVFALTLPTLPVIEHRGNGQVFLYDVHQDNLVVKIRANGSLTAFGQVDTLLQINEGTGAVNSRHLACRRWLVQSRDARTGRPQVLELPHRGTSVNDLPGSAA